MVNLSVVVQAKLLMLLARRVGEQLLRFPSARPKTLSVRLQQRVQPLMMDVGLACHMVLGPLCWRSWPQLSKRMPENWQNWNRRMLANRSNWHAIAISRSLSTTSVSSPERPVIFQELLLASTQAAIQASSAV